ncbi:MULTISPECIES: DUF4238 domain-containing protein [Brevundimonas]|jgi:hypothetical protein|nr:MULTISPECIES: DUF4238 domain-containing protein [Brevundimonas]
MTSPKRHHWWPQVQSRYWTGADGLVNVVRADGTGFRANPINLGVESELYTRFGPDDSKDPSIEDWFANTVDQPAGLLIDHLSDASLRKRHPYAGDPDKAAVSRQLGMRTPGYIDVHPLPDEVRMAAARYVAALLVRHPRYLSKLTEFHRLSAPDNTSAKSAALDNMGHVFGVYVETILSATFMISQRTGTAEFIYADGGIVVDEPWAPDIPFTMHVPLTPDVALQVLPVPNPIPLREVPVIEATNPGVARMNRITLSAAQRFVFTRQAPPTTFIRRYFGVPAPASIGYRFINGRLETRYEPGHM